MLAFIINMKNNCILYWYTRYIKPESFVSRGIITARSIQPYFHRRLAWSQHTRPDGSTLINPSPSYNAYSINTLNYRYSTFGWLAYSTKLKTHWHKVRNLKLHQAQMHQVATPSIPPVQNTSQNTQRTLIIPPT